MFVYPIIMGNTTLHIEPYMTEQQNREIEKTVKRERGRLFSFIRSRVSDPEEAEDILQDVFYQLTETYRLMKPVEQWTAWLFRVARNKITDRYRKKKTERLDSTIHQEEDGEPLFLTDLIASEGVSANDEMMRDMLMEEVERALEELPEDQRNVFVWHEIEGRSFQEMSEETGVTVNTLLSRKRYAVIFLRERLKELYSEMFND
jgi:RNA polymerase sigma factor (sigma-70 family)